MNIFSKQFLWPINFMLALFAVVLLSVAGCDQTTTGTVSGKVLLDGQPITSGRVMAANANARTASGIIQSDGSYELSTRVGSGLEPGKYDLWVIAYEGGQMIEPEANAKLAIPARYAEQSTAGFSTTIVASEKIKFDLELSSE